MPDGLHPKQTVFLLAPQREVLFGGAAGGGKSEGLLAGGLQYVDIPQYAGIIFRRTFRDLALPGALMDRAHEWLDHTDAKWVSKDYTWRFPSGATLSFGYLEKDIDKYRYQSAEFQYVAFDELTQFTREQYVYLFSRLRRLKGTDIPIRMRTATNPGGVGHEWVKRRFIGTKRNPMRNPNRIFIPATLEDNPSLDQTEYDKSLSELDIITRRQLRHGDWDIDPRGGMFQRHWFRFEERRPKKYKYIVRYWDMAGTEKSKDSKDPDYTVGTLLGLDERNEYWVLNVIRFRETPAQNEYLIRRTAERDGHGIDVYMEREPGSSGKGQIDHYRRNVLYGYTFRKHDSTGSKVTRAKPVSSSAEGGNFHVMNAEWNEPWLDELSIFDDGAHDDQVDSLSGGYDVITRKLKTQERRQAKQRYAYKRK